MHGRPFRRLARPTRRAKTLGIDADEIVSDNASFVLHAESDEDAGGDGIEDVEGDGTAVGDLKQLALVETGRFTGVFQGYLRLTDADGDGATDQGPHNWGLPKTSADNTLAL